MELQLTNPLSADMKPYLERAAQLTEGIASLSLQARALQITDDDTRRQCMELLNNAKSRIKGLTSLWKSVKDPVNSIRSTILACEKETLQESEGVANICESKLKAFDRAQIEAKRKIEEELARDARRKQAELDEKERELRAEGFVKEANAVSQQITILDHMPVLPEAIEKVAGTSVTKVWKATVTDTISVINAIATGKVKLMQDCNGQMRPLVIVDQVVLNAMVKRLGDGLNIPGVSVEEDIRYTSRR